MIRRFVDWLFDAAAWLAAAFVFAIFAVMIGGSAMRMLGLPTGGSDDIVAWCCAAAGFLAMAHTFRRGDFVRVVLLIERLDVRRRRTFEIVALVIARCSSPIFCGRRRSSSTRAGISTTWRTA